MADVAQDRVTGRPSADVTRVVFELIGSPGLAVEVAAEMVTAIRGRGFVVRAATAGDVDVLALAP